MLYTYTCKSCGWSDTLIRPASQCDTPQPCPNGHLADRDFLADWKTIQTPSSSRNANKVKDSKRVCGASTKAAARRKEAAYGEHIHERRKQLANDGNKRSSFKHTHSIPAELFHGKKKETGDDQYWNDPKNVAKHSDFKVS
jgi:hypothetical protein